MSGRRALTARRRKAPLRLVVNHQGEMLIDGVPVPAVELECGHKLHPPEDYRGRRYPERMRCPRCLSTQPHHPTEA